MNKKTKKVLKMLTCMITTFSLASQISFAKDLSYSTSEESVELEPGYYEDVTIDGSKIYEKGYSDGLSHASFTETFDTIIVDPGKYGMFSSDSSTEAKTFKGSSTTGIDLGMTASGSYSDYLSFSGWDISVSNKVLTLTAKFESPTSFNFTGGVQKWLCTETGTYKLTVIGAGNGDQQRGGGLMVGTMKIEEGTILYVYVGGSGTNGTGGSQAGGFNGGGNGYAAGSGDSASGGAGATDIRVGGTSLNDRVIVGGGGGGRAAWGNGGNSYGGYTSGGTGHHYTGSEPYTNDGKNHGGNVYAYPGTQTSGYALGQGQSATNRTVGSYGAAWGGGGGGYWGGYATTASGQSSACDGGGGSSYYKQGTVTHITDKNGYQSSNGMAKIEKVE